MSYLVPENLETERLYLRMPKESDWSDLYEYYSDPECTRYTNGKPMSETESWRKIASLVGHWQLRSYGSYALEEKTSGKVIGVAGFEFPKGWPDPEIQWGLARQFWRKGYATEAVKAIKQVGFKLLPDISFISIIHPENANSIALAKKIAASYDRTFLFRNDTWHIYRHSMIS